MLTLIVGAQVFDPMPAGRRQVLVAGSRIAAVAERVELGGAALQTIDAEGRWLVPGFVDALTHPCGGGGEGGFHNRTPEVGFEEFARAGVTSPVGALGTDSVTRSLEVLYGAVMALTRRGLDASMYTGSYRVPPATLTGDVARDLTLIAPVIGVGELAIADHRSSQPTAAELRRVAADARLGGVLSGRGGTVLVHVGDGDGGLALLREALAGGDLPIHCFYPTHVNRTRALLQQGFDFARSGGAIDFTASTTPELLDAGEVPALQALREAVAAGVPARRVTLSSDAGGSLPVYRDGALEGLTSASPAALLELLRGVLREDASVVADVLAAMTRNPAAALGLPGKGRITVGADADLLLLDPTSGALGDVMCRGRWLLRDGELVAG